MKEEKNHKKTDDRIAHLKDQYEKTDGLPKCIIVDIDGTLALMNGRYVYGSKEAINDVVNTPVKELINLYDDENYVIILLSGRAHDELVITKEFLKKNDIWYDRIILRKEGDIREDSIIKKELYEENIKGIYDVKFVLDDRNQVVDMWRKDLKLPCFQVYYGDF